VRQSKAKQSTAKKNEGKQSEAKQTELLNKTHPVAPLSKSSMVVAPMRFFAASVVASSWPLVNRERTSIWWSTKPQNFISPSKQGAEVILADVSVSSAERIVASLFSVASCVSEGKKSDESGVSRIFSLSAE
jgi:hypothetical protein